MQLLPENIYHIYNRGNNSQPIFYNERNYDYFLAKISTHFSEHSDIICYCLMPNHFHLMIQVKPNTEGTTLNNEIAIMLRSYARAINIQEDRTGSLFQQKTKAKSVGAHSLICFNYIHQNPLKAGIVKKIEDWRYSSFNEYLGNKSNLLSNIELGRKIIDFKSKEEFYKLSYQNIDPAHKEDIF